MSIKDIPFPYQFQIIRSVVGTVVDSLVCSETPVFAVVGVVAVGGDDGVAGVGAKDERNLTQKLIRYKIKTFLFEMAYKIN